MCGCRIQLCDHCPKSPKGVQHGANPGGLCAQPTPRKPSPHPDSSKVILAPSSGAQRERATPTADSPPGGSHFTHACSGVAGLGPAVGALGRGRPWPQPLAPGRPFPHGDESGFLLGLRGRPGLRGEGSEGAEAARRCRPTTPCEGRDGDRRGAAAQAARGWLTAASRRRPPAKTQPCGADLTCNKPPRNHKGGCLQSTELRALHSKVKRPRP